MAQSDDAESESPSARVPRGKIEAAMESVAEYRRDLIRAVQMGADRDQRLLRGFHAAVINYYEELRVYRDWPAIEDEWSEMRMWPVQEDPSLRVGYLLRDHHVEVVEAEEEEEEDGDGGGTPERTVRLTDAGKAVVLDDEWVRGVDAIETWMNRTSTVRVSQAGLGRGTTEQRVPEHMPPRILLAAARALDTVARELGVSMNKVESTPRTEIDRELVDEVNEWWEEKVGKTN